LSGKRATFELDSAVHIRLSQFSEDTTKADIQYAVAILAVAL